jgi:Tfp pilus assembly protein PilP
MKYSFAFLCFFVFLSSFTYANEEGLTLKGAMGFRDPFKKLVTQTQIKKQEIPPLRQYNLEQLKLVGVLSGTKKNKAMISAPDGKVFIVTEQDPIGNRKGIVKKIAPDFIQIEDKVLNILGEEEKIETRILFEQVRRM